MHPAERELRRVTGLHANKDEPQSRFLRRLCKATDHIDDDTWESLSGDAQRWTKNALRSIKDGDPIPGFPKYKERAMLESKSANSGGGSSGGSRPKPKPSAGKAPVKKAAPPAKEKTKQAKPASMRKTLRRLVIRKPTISLEDLTAALNKAGFSPTPVLVAAGRSSVRDMLKIMKEEGLIKIEL